ncbi:MAG: class I SAM-dependent methyltransferase [Methylococcales bacterium]|nr:class I SAM-dependent methyltransferase [Methylococcales bacterium]
MSYDETVSEHYTHGELLGAIQASITKLGKTIDNVTIQDLAPVDEFHIGGRLATDNLLDQLNFSEKDHILDVGCGLGGASRFVANKYNNCVTGIDLTQEYIDVGKALCAWVGLEKQVTLHQGSALSMPFEDETFDGAIMLHVGMNIDDKAKLFTEVYRVLRPGTSFGVYDVMQINDGELTYPVPWATENSMSRLATSDQYKQALNHARFNASKENVRRDFALEFFNQMRAKTEANEGPPPLGLHTLMRESIAVKVRNMIDNIAANLIAPVEIIAQKS